MKKLSIFAAALLALGFTSCVETDNPVDNDDRQVISLDGVDYKTDLVATFTGEVGTEVSLGLGVYAPYDIYGVDFGDGVIVTDTVGWHNGGVREGDEEAPAEKPGTTHTSLTKFVGTIVGDGIVKVYGNSDVWAATLEKGIVPTGLDAEKLQRIHELTISGADIEELSLPALEELTQLNVTNTPVKSVDVSQAPALTSLSIIHTSTSTYDESPLASIDVSKNTKLETIQLGNGFYKPGILTSLDLSNNTAIKGIYAADNKLTEVKLPAGANLDVLNLGKNELTAIDLSGIESVKTVTLNANKLTAIDLSKLAEGTATANTVNVANNQLTELVVPVGIRTLEAQNNLIAKISIVDCSYSCKVENNKLTFATLPTKPAGLNTAAKIKRFTYAPQDTIIKVTTDFDVLDLTAEAKAQGILDAAADTKFVFKNGETAIPEENYTVKDGKITFLHAYSKLVGELTNEAFPNLTLTTTEFATKITGTDVQASEEVVYALKEGDAFKSDETVTVKDGVVTITFGEAGGADFKAAKANASVDGYTAWTEGNGENGNKTGGTFYTIKPAKDGTVEVAVVLNAGKAFYILENDTALDDYNGIKVDEKYYGTYSFKVKAGNAYKVYCSGSKLGFYGFKFTY